jgi:hypothetical protein
MRTASSMEKERRLLSITHTLQMKMRNVNVNIDNRGRRRNTGEPTGVAGSCRRGFLLFVSGEDDEKALAPRSCHVTVNASARAVCLLVGDKTPKEEGGICGSSQYFWSCVVSLVSC